MHLPFEQTGVVNYVSEAVDYATRAAAFRGVTTVVDFVLPGGIDRAGGRDARKPGGMAVHTSE